MGRLKLNVRHTFSFSLFGEKLISFENALPPHDKLKVCRTTLKYERAVQRSRFSLRRLENQWLHQPEKM